VIAPDSARRPGTTTDPFFSTAAEAGTALGAADVPYVVVGGLGSSIRGRPRWTDDVDVLVAPEDAGRALEALARAGYATEETNPHWIYKATRHDVVVDVIFAAKGGIYLDGEMVRRATTELVGGGRVRVAAPEDLIVMKAVAHDEPSMHHWHDALGIIASCDLDWAYLLERGQHGARRLLSLLVYAQSDDLVVPEGPIRELVATIYDG
jgi:hypothetical protein